MNRYRCTFKLGSAAVGVIVAVALTHTALAGGPPDTTITYQGLLQDGGANVSGPTNMEFRLFDAETLGNQVGSTVAEIVNVTDGIFTALLDFGVDPYTSSQPLWLEVTVEGEPLTRQQVTSAPFSLATRGLNVDAAGRVGLGVDAPLTPLALLGNGGVNPVGVTQNQVGSTSTMELTTEDGQDLQATRVLLRGGSDAADIEFYRGGRGVEARTMHLEGSTGHVGIGTDTPGARLSVVSTPAYTSNCCTPQAPGTPGCDDTTCQDLVCTADPFCCDIEWDQLCADQAVSDCAVCDVPEDPALTAMGGNVGIGTMSPTSELDVVGTVNATAFVGDGSGLTNISGGSSVWDENGSDISYTSGNVGIGTTAPASRLSIFDGDLELKTNDNTEEQSIFFRNSGPATAWRIFRADAGSSDADLLFAGGESSTDISLLPPRMVLKHDGNVGIGTTSPEAKLHVIDGSFSAPAPFGNSALVLERSNNAFINILTPNGTQSGLRFGDESSSTSGGMLYFHGDDHMEFRTQNTAQLSIDANGTTSVKVLEITGGADIVEGFDSSSQKELEPGTVVVIDPDSPGKLTGATQAYDKKVAGVVSGAGGVTPGIKLGQDGMLDGDLPVAMTGRVYVKCSTENGPIRPGDRLTTASLAGHAMRATDSTRSDGAVIGKAMSALDSGTGLVLVLVNLQ